MRPPHRHFGHPQPEEAQRQIEHLDIEGEVIDLTAAEDGGGGALGEELEAALGVVDAGHGDGANEQVEETSARLPQERLAFEELGALHVAGADGDVVACVELCEQLFDLFDGGGEIGVAEENALSACLEHALSDGIAFAAIRVVGEEADLGSAGGDGVDEGDGVVGASVVYDEYLEGVVSGVEIGEHAFEGGAEAFLFVVGGDDDGEAWGQSAERFACGQVGTRVVW